MTPPPIARNGVVVTAQGYAVVNYLAMFGPTKRRVIIYLLHLVTTTNPWTSFNDVFTKAHEADLIYQQTDEDEHIVIDVPDAMAASRFLQGIRSNGYIDAADEDVSLTAEGERIRRLLLTPVQINQHNRT